MSAEPSAAELVMTLDGTEVSFALGETILEVAHRCGKTIPTLCYDQRLAPFGSCRLCVVAVKGTHNPVAACTTRAVMDTEVWTTTAQIEEYRRILLELVASENPKVAVDPLRGYSSQEMALLVDQYDADSGRFAGRKSGHSRPDDDNPFLLRDYDLCISCYRCVRVCAEQEGDYAISVANRGFQTRIVTEFDSLLRDSACTFCGQCIQTCPTGALADKKALRFAGG